MFSIALAWASHLSRKGECRDHATRSWGGKDDKEDDGLGWKAGSGKTPSSRRSGSRCYPKYKGHEWAV